MFHFMEKSHKTPRPVRPNILKGDPVVGGCTGTRFRILTSEASILRVILRPLETRWACRPDMFSSLARPLAGATDPNGGRFQTLNSSFLSSFLDLGD